MPQDSFLFIPYFTALQKLKTKWRIIIHFKLRKLLQKSAESETSSTPKHVAMIAQKHAHFWNID